MIWQNSTISFFATIICSSSMSLFRNKKPKNSNKETKNLLFQTYRVCWLSNHRYQGIQFQATALDYCTKYLLEDDMDNLWVQLNLIFVCILVYYQLLVKKSNLNSYLRISYSWEWAKEPVCFHPCTLGAISNRKSAQTVTCFQIGRDFVYLVLKFIQLIFIQSSINE